jgi:phosphosulfolactate synthase (CoM biosynthesis protein A)
MSETNPSSTRGRTSTRIQERAGRRSLSAVTMAEAAKRDEEIQIRNPRERSRSRDRINRGLDKDLITNIVEAITTTNSQIETGRLVEEKQRERRQKIEAFPVDKISFSGTQRENVVAFIREIEAYQDIKNLNDEDMVPLFKHVLKD